MNIPEPLRPAARNAVERLLVTAVMETGHLVRGDLVDDDAAERVEVLRILVASREAEALVDPDPIRKEALEARRRQLDIALAREGLVKSRERIETVKRVLQAAGEAALVVAVKAAETYITSEGR